MTVYVDPLIQTAPSMKWPYHQACHMVADSLNELHMMAGRLGLRRRWFQGNSTLPHYNLTANKRNLALRLGAREITYQQMKEILQRADETVSRPDPDETDTAENELS